MTDPIPTAAIRDLTRLTDVALSPKGRTIAVVTSEFDGEADETYASLWTVPTDGSARPHRLTRTAGASAPAWSPDGRTLAFLAAREADLGCRVARPAESEEEEDEDEAENGDDEPEQQVWAFDLDRGGDARQLTDRDHGVREFDWGPNGDRIVFSARDPTEDQEQYLEEREEGGPIEIERLQHKADGVGFTDDVRTYLFVHDLETGDAKRLDEAYGAGAMEPLGGLQPGWHPTDDVIAFVTCGRERPDDSLVTNVYAVDVSDGERTQLTDLDYGISGPDWSPTGDQLVVSGTPADNWYRPADVFVVDRTVERVHRLTEGFEPTVARYGTPQFLDEKTVLGVFGDRGHSTLYRIDLDGDCPSVIAGAVDRDESVSRFAVEGDTLACSITNPTAGHDVYVMDGLDAEPERLTQLNGTLVDDWQMPGFDRIETTDGETTVESLLYYPDSFDPDAPTPHPVLVWPHGGPMSYDDPCFRFDHAYFTSRGYVICKPNYRGSTSYGSAFAEVLKGKWGTVEVEDVLAVTDDLVERGIADAERLFATGFSYGAILTGYLVTRTDRFVAAAAEHGIYDLRSDFGAGDSQAWMGSEFGLPWRDRDPYDAASSFLDAGEVDTPTLVTAGGQDWRCPPHQSEQFYVALRKQDVPAKLVVYPDEHHAVGEPERAIHRLEALADWFERHDPTVEESD